MTLLNVPAGGRLCKAYFAEVNLGPGRPAITQPEYCGA